MNQNEYTRHVIEQYLSLCKPLHCQANLSVSDYIMLRKQAIWEYSNYSFSQDTPSAPKVTHAPSLPITSNTMPSQASTLMESSPGCIPPNTSLATHPYLGESGGQQPSPLEAFKTETIPTKTPEVPVKEEKRSQSPGQDADIVRIFRSMGE